MNIWRSERIEAGLKFILNLQGNNSLNLFSEQFVYGHREILLKHANLDYSNQIVGYLQHGFYLPSEWDYNMPRLSLRRKCKMYVFSRLDSKRAVSLGHRNVFAIGAPWIYLKRNLDQRYIRQRNIEKRYLVMPFHSQTAVPDSSSRKSKLERAKKFREIVGNEFSTVCLHSVDFLDPETREAFQDQGFQVTCLGGTGGLPWSHSAGRVTMLSQLHILMNSHTHFLTDTVGTPLFYAVSMGMKIAIFPEIRELVNLSAISGNIFDNETEKKANLGYARENFAPAIGNFADSGEFSFFADEILGVHNLLSSDELRSVIDYIPNVLPSTIPVEPW